MHPAHSSSVQAAGDRRRRDFLGDGRVRKDPRGRKLGRSLDRFGLQRAGTNARHQSRTAAVAGTRRIWQHCRSGRNGMKDWRHAWPLIWSQRRDAVAGLVLSLLAIAASLLQPWPMQIIVDDILGTKPMPGWLTADKPAALLVVCVGLLAIHFLRWG